jgi:hypothetical protein
MEEKLTRQQQKALHLYYQLLADELNDSGWTIQKLLSNTVEINWTKNLIKELLWRPIQKMLTEKESTTNLNKIQEIDLVYEHINRHVSELCGIHVPFPKLLSNEEDSIKSVGV